MIKLMKLFFLVLSISNFSLAGQFGNWEGNTDGWVDWSSNKLSIDDPSLMPSKYQYATYGATSGSQSLKLSTYNKSHTLAIKMTKQQRTEFLANNIFSIDLSVAADTLGVGGYAKVTNIIINAPGIGWTPNPMNGGFSFWDGSGPRSMTIELDYSYLKAGISENPNYLNIIIETYARRATNPYGPADFFFDNAQLNIKKSTCPAQWDLDGDDCFVNMTDLSILAQNWLLGSNGYDITDAQNFTKEWIQCLSPKCKPNVLFIAVDDLRPELNCYGQTKVISPNIDKLATHGILFSRAYCQVPVCGASRASLLTGIRPNRNRFVEFDTRAEIDTPNAITLPKHFKNNGYHTIADGKIFHHSSDFSGSWSENHWSPGGHWRDYQLQENIDLQNAGSGPAYENADVDDDEYWGGKLANKAVSDLQRLKDMDKPFFLAVGFYKPHLPFNAPKKYWDMYPISSIQLPDNYYVPANAPSQALHTWGELRGYHGIPSNGPLSDGLAKTLIQGYYACTTYTDAMIGKILNELETLGLKDNTIVVLWGDHGWSLGEHTFWCKHCNFDTAMRAPLIISAPGYSENIKCKSLVEFIDIFPTLCELADLDHPTPTQLHGQSLVPILKDPTISLKDSVFCRYIFGDSVRTDQYIYTEWANKNTGELNGRMLYDHFTDQNENINISEEPEMQNIIDTILAPKLDDIRLY